ncbi:MAG: FAD-binding oxidoreductase [Gemmatimonadales bacterium]|nr:FAD-binding oxidoreductase [Gemmatimonadales bacterium]MBP7620622.1 FAD-binding oxidoreductase [Gemmatimonadales bacterium]
MPVLLRTDSDLRARYAQGGGVYRIIPAAVARPTTLAELRAVLTEAHAAGLAITPRGAGSAMDGGNVGEGVVLDLTAFDAGRCVVDAAARLAICTPSLTIPTVQRAAAAHDLHLPMDPSSAGWATLGGLIGTNASGARTVRDGAMRRWVEAVTLETDDGPLTLARGIAPDQRHPVIQRWQRDVLPLLARHRAAILARWPRTRKQSFGYDLAAWWASGDLVDLVIGAEGTLGVMTEVTVRLAPIAAHRLALRVVLADRALLVPALETVRRHDPAVLEFLDGSFLRLVEADVPSGTAAVLLADLEGEHADELQARAAALQQDLAGLGAGVTEAVVAADAAAIAALWRIRHGASPRLAALTDGRQSMQIIEDGCVPPAALGRYLDAVDAACRAERIDAVMFGHAGDGHVHVNLLPNLRKADWLGRVRGVYEEVAGALLALGGTPSGEHGAGRLRAPLIERFLGPEAVTCFQAIKTAFDPAGRHNPGVILADGHDPLSRLKVGPDAAPLPAGMAEALAAIEREGRWGESRWSNDDR